MLNRTDRFSGLEGVAGPGASRPRAFRERRGIVEHFYARDHQNTAPIGALAR